MFNRLTNTPTLSGIRQENRLILLMLLVAATMSLNNLHAQDCGPFGGTAELVTPTESHYLLPYCDEFSINTQVYNLGVANEDENADVYIQVSFGTNDENDPLTPIGTLEAITYTGNLTVFDEDTWAASGVTYRRFWFEANNLIPGGGPQSDFLTFQITPTDFFISGTLITDVRFVYQDVVSCGNFTDVAIDGIQGPWDDNLYFTLSENPISGNVRDLINSNRLNPESFDLPFAQYKTINGTLVVDEDHKFDGVSGRTKLYLLPGAKILVKEGYKLHLDKVDIFTCDQLAAGIEVEGGATLIVEYSNIKDCRFAIDAKPGAILELIDNTFSDNYIGLNLDMSTGSAGSRRVEFKTMSGNTFQTLDGLKTPYSGMPESVEHRGFCGVMLKNYEHFNVGGNQSFEQLANGIVGLNSTGNITYMTFEDMNSVDQSAVYPHEGFGIHLQGKNGSYWFNINQTYTTMSFDNCKTGVYAKSYAGRVAGTSMTNVDKGIEWTQSNNRDIFFRENEITARQYGIKTFFNEPVHSYSIMSDNNITITEGLGDGNNSVGAIEMSELSMGSDPTGPIPVTTTSDGWEVKGSIITMEKGGNGILYRNGVNGIVNANNINNESEPNDYKGINTLGSFFIGVSNNTIFQETSAGLGTAFGIYSAGGQANTFQCNCVDKTNVGMQFFDMADFPNAVRGNNFNKHCTGLQLGFDGVGGTIIGDQVHIGNLWDLSAITGSCLGARNYGSLTDIALSEFFVNGNSNPSLNPSVFPNSGWFNDESSSTYNACTSCSFPTTIPTRITETNTPTAFDFDVASGTYITSDYTNEMLWKARYRLYRKLLRRPALESYNSVFTTFKSGYQNTSIGKLAFIAEQKALLFNLTEEQDSILENRRLAYKFYENDMRILDSLMQAGATVSQTTYNNTKGFAANAVDLYEVYANSMRTLRTQKIQSLDSLNTLVSTFFTPDANQKTVNDIVFHFLLNDSIASADMTTLEGISEQCPLEGGDAVYEARALVGYFTGQQYEDEILCATQPREQITETKINSEEFNVFPNPTTGEIRWTGLGIDVSSVQVFNLLGQLQLQQNTTAPRADLSRLPEGLYTVQFFSDDNILLISKKIQLIRL